MLPWRVAILTALLAGACGNSSAAVNPSPSPSPRLAGTVRETKEDCFFAPPIEHVPAGQVTFGFENQTGQRAGFDVWPIKDGKTFSDFVNFVSGERALALAGKDLHDPIAVFGYGPTLQSKASANESGSVTGHLGAGEYAVACFRFFDERADFGPSAVAGPITVEAA